MTRATLDTIRIVYCAPYSLALYGIPYDMRRDVGQAPRHLWQAAHDRPRGMSSHVNPIEGWIYLDDRDPIVRAWLTEQRALDNLPGNPHEWTTL